MRCPRHHPPRSPERTARSRATVFLTSDEAEAAFYAAFSAADVDAMMRVWAPGVAIACIHPAGPRLEGSAAIRASWAHILGDPVLRAFELRGQLILGDDEFRIHSVEENITVPGTAFVAPPVLATNVYQRLDDGWYMVLHHGGVAPARLPAQADTSTANVRRLH